MINRKLTVRLVLLVGVFDLSISTRYGDSILYSMYYLREASIPYTEEMTSSGTPHSRLALMDGAMAYGMVDVAAVCGCCDFSRVDTIGIRKRKRVTF